MLRPKLSLGLVSPLLVALPDAFKGTVSLSPRGRCLGLTWERGGQEALTWAKVGEASLTTMKQRRHVQTRPLHQTGHHQPLQVHCRNFFLFLVRHPIQHRFLLCLCNVHQIRVPSGVMHICIVLCHAV